MAVPIATAPGSLTTLNRSIGSSIRLALPIVLKLGRGDELAGGILGIVIGGAFIGESMFYHITEGSKAAMVKLVERLRSRDFVLFDAQMMNPHLERFGAYVISDKAYNRLLKSLSLATARCFRPATSKPLPVSLS